MKILISDRQYNTAFDWLYALDPTGDRWVIGKQPYVWKDDIRLGTIEFTYEEDAIAFKLKFGL